MKQTLEPARAGKQVSRPSQLLWKDEEEIPSSAVQFSLVQFTQLCPTPCDPMDCSTPGLPVHHQLLELTQTPAHWVSDGIQPSYPLSSPSPAFNLSQHQSFFQWVRSLHQVTWSIGVSASTSVLPMNTQDWSPLGWAVGSPCSPRDSQESSPTP